MQYAGYLWSGLGLVALTFWSGVASAAPKTPSQMGVCAPAQKIAGIDATDPTVIASSVHNTTFVYYSSDRSLGGNNRIHVVNFGPDGRPNTLDDSTIQLTTGSSTDADSAPASDGRYLSFTRTNGTIMSTMLYDIGADLMPGTNDDIPETIIASYPIPTPFGTPIIKASVYDGLIGWVVNDLSAPGQTALAMCDARKLVGQPGGCQSTILPVRLPHRTSASNLVMYRDYSTGAELQVGFVHTITFSGIFSFSHGSFAFESNLGVVMPWPGNVAVNVLGIYAGVMPVLSDSDFRNPRLGTLGAPHSGPSLSLPFNAPEFLVAAFGSAATANGAPAFIWQSDDEMLYHPMLTSNLKQIKLNLNNIGAAPAPLSVAVDGEMVAFEHTEIVPTRPRSTIVRYGLYASYCG